ncbi:antigen B membrane, partial [Brachionus plicatilis]
NIEFDSNLQIVRYETRDRFNNNSDINFDKYPHVFVNDYTIGVSYIKNKHTGRCRIESIDQFAFATDSNFTQAQLDSGNGYALRSKSASSLLELDLDYFYNGQREIDGIKSDIFVAKIDVSKNISVVNEYFFTPQNFTTQTINQKETNVPKRLAKKSLDAGFSSVSTFYNFETSEINIHHFDVSKCYADDSLISFKIVLKPRTDIHLQILRRANLNKALSRKIYLALGELTQENSLRFSIPRITLSDDGYVYVRSAILPGPEPLTLFKLFPQKLLTSTGFTYASNIPSAEACALRCLGSTECLSFDYNNNTKGCYLNKKHYSNGTFSGFTSSYDHYSRNSLFFVKFSEKYIIWGDLNIKLNSNSTSFELQVKDYENQLYPVVLDAVSVEEVKNNENRFGSTAYLSKYNLKKPNFKFKKNNDDLSLKLNIDECAKKCTQEIGSPCNSFHYCFLTSECVLSQNVLVEGSSNYEENNFCDIYEKDALSHYSFFNIKASINPDDKKIDPVQSSSECASKCDNELDIHCRSFNYCPNTKECYLSERHLVDGTIDGSTSLVCDHYSRKYISDFTYIDTNEIPLNGEIVLKEMTGIDFCSFECINSDGFNCKSFDYCPESKTCILNSGQIPTGSSIQNVTKDSCSHYRREYFFATSSKSKSSDSSKSTLTALSIIFGLLSIIFGAIGKFYV